MGPEVTLAIVCLALLAGLLWAVATLQRITHRLITQNIELQRFKAAGAQERGTAAAALRSVEDGQHQPGEDQPGALPLAQ